MVRGAQYDYKQECALVGGMANLAEYASVRI